jgi:hypothetical protein
MSDAIYSRFIDKVIIDSKGCWLWTASKTNDGYGKFYPHGKVTLAHRFSYEYFIDVIPQGLCVCHVCDNPSCVNPTHLFLGSHQDNMTDRNNKMRQSNAALCESDIPDIRALSKSRSQNEIARIYHISRHLVSDIIHGIKWKTA